MITFITSSKRNKRRFVSLCNKYQYRNLVIENILSMFLHSKHINDGLTIVDWDSITFKNVIIDFNIAKIMKNAVLISSELVEGFACVSNLKQIFMGFSMGLKRKGEVSRNFFINYELIDVFENANIKE